MQFVNANTLLFAVFTLMSIVLYVTKKYSDMKNINKIIDAVVILAFGLAIILMVMYQSDIQKEIRTLKQHIDSIMVHRSKLDSLYWDHLEVCKFELKDGIVTVEN